MYRIDRYRLLALLLLAAPRAEAQESAEPADAPRFSIDAGCGHSVKTYLARGIPHRPAGGGLILARVNWRAASFFGFSLEAGWITIAEERRAAFLPERGISQAAMRLDAFPASFEIFFPASWGEIRAGAGASLVRSRIDAWGERSEAERLSGGYLLSYGRPVSLSSGWALQPEIALILIPDIDLLLIAPALRCRCAL